MEERKFSRKELYNLIWSKPLTTLAKEYAILDNGLRMTCVKYDIPLPAGGYWMKVKFRSVHQAKTVRKQNAI